MVGADAPRPMAALPVSPDVPGVLANLVYEAGAATCSLVMHNPEPGDVLEHIGPEMAFCLYVYGPDATARRHFTQSLLQTTPHGSTTILLTGGGPQDAADAWRAYTNGRGAVIAVDAPDYVAMMEKLYGSIIPLIEEPPQANLAVIGEAGKKP